jgi:hypothetical protein
MALPRIRHVGGRGTFALPDGNEVSVTNKFNILSGPEQWLAPIGLASLAMAMRDADDSGSDRLHISTDPPDKFDRRYPNHLREVHLERSQDAKCLAVVFWVERDDEEADAVVERELMKLLSPIVARYRGRGFEANRHEDFPEVFVVSFDLLTHGRTVGDALAIGDEAYALVSAAKGGRLSLQSALDLVRSGYGAALIGQPEGPWFDGKQAPYFLGTDDKKWELAKDVAAFANSPTGGLIFIGAKTKRHHDGDVLQAISDFELDLLKPPQYRSNLSAKMHPAVEGLEIRTLPTRGTRGTAYIYVPAQRDELKPFVVKGVVVSGSVRATHVCIPVRDGEDTRYAGSTEVHALLQAGRIALRRPLVARAVEPLA